MIAELIKYSPNDSTIIKPIHESITPDDLWLMLHDCGFNNMYVCSHAGLYNSVNILNWNIPKFKVSYPG